MSQAKAAAATAKVLKSQITGKPKPCPPDRSADLADCKEQVATLEARKDEI